MYLYQYRILVGAILYGTEKSPAVGYISKCCYQCALQLLIRNFEHSHDQATSGIALSKKSPWQWQKLFSSKQKTKNELTKYHGIFITFKSCVSQSKQGSWDWVVEFGSKFLCLGKGKIFFDNFNLANLFDLHCLHEKGKLIEYVSDRVYTFFKKRSCCSTLLY